MMKKTEKLFLTAFATVCIAYFTSLILTDFGIPLSVPFYLLCSLLILGTVMIYYVIFTK